MNIHESLRDLAVPLGKLASLPGNPRLGDIDAVARSYNVFGQRKPIVARRTGGSDEDPTGIVIAGNHQFAAAQQLGWESIAVVWTDDDEMTAKAFALADNRTADLGTYDDSALTEMLQEVAADAELLAAASFSDVDIEELLGKTTQLPTGNSDPDEVPEPPGDPIAKVGDVWQLGPHRVVCGDSTEAEALGDFEPDVVFTDPPYGIDYRAMRGGKAIAGDASRDEAEPLIAAALGPAATTGTMFVCCDWRSHGTVLAALEAIGVAPKATIVWDKQRGVQNLDRYHKQHEFIVYAGPYGGQPTQAGDVWSFARDFDPDHPTPKPVELIELALTTASLSGQKVYDPFGGSGSTLIAAHRTGRVARLVELDPRYVDVICRRYQEHTSEKPILESTGEPHDFTAE